MFYNYFVPQMNSSAVIELSDGGGDDDVSVGDMEISAGTRQQPELHPDDRDDDGQGLEGGLMDAMKSQMADSVREHSFCCISGQCIPPFHQTVVQPENIKHLPNVR